MQEMQRANVKKIVFSSSATVYGAPKSVPVREDFPRSAVNPYGNAKIIVEDILGDLYRADPGWAIVALRYFNPVGAHESGLIGENLSGTPNNLMPCITQTAIGTRDCLSIFGGDYNTPDGTGIRDYIHVMDLAEGHVAAMQRLDKVVEGVLTVNLGTGRGTSVLELVDAFRAVSGKTIPYKIVERRAGDVAEYWADPSLAYELFGWKAKRSLQEMCADSWAAAHSAANRSAK
ncbi:hypothetical protein FACS1894205_5930 [Alphaproteobacteria bacterium]|nr:hypothetical protein FACS1894205_5930 [Alphaproteobacteria bacterium]